MIECDAQPSTAAGRAPESEPPSPRTPWLIALGVMAALVLLAVVVVRLIEPVERGWAPPCVFHDATGWHCPGCGATRMVQAMAYGRVGEAFGHNPMLFALLSGSAVFFTVMAIGGWRWREISGRVPLWAYWAAAAGVVGYAIARNLPWEPLAWLAP